MGFLFLRLARKEPVVWSHGAHIFLHLPRSPHSGQRWEDAGKSLLLHLLTPGAGCAPRDALFELFFIGCKQNRDSKFMCSVCPMLPPCRMLCWEALAHRWYVKSSCAKVDWCFCTDNWCVETLICACMYFSSQSITTFIFTW